MGTWKKKSRYKIAVPRDFELRNLRDFLALVFDNGSGKEYVERRIEIAYTLLTRLRDKKETYREDWLEVILEALDEKEILNKYRELLKMHELGMISKTQINEIIRKMLEERGYKVSSLIYDYQVALKALKDLNLISFTSTRINLATVATFSRGLQQLINFYAMWRAGELD